MTQVDDIQSFIAAQKRRIEEERAGLVQPSIGHRNHGSQRNAEKRYQLPEGNSTNIPRQEQPKAPKKDTSPPTGLQLGGYENVQEKLRKERAEEYKKFLAEKSYRTTGEKSPRNQPVQKPPMKSAIKQDVPRAVQTKSTFNGDFNDSQRRRADDSSEKQNLWRAGAQTPKTLDELYDAYEELLARKRQDERRYRGAMDDPYLDSRHVRFEEDTQRTTQREPWLENGARRRWDNPDRDFNRGRRYSNSDYEDSRGDFQERSRERREEAPEDRISRSAPPTAAAQAVPLIGEYDMSPEVKQQRQTKYREELQAQMKEREMQKKREKDHRYEGDKQDSGLPNGDASPGRYQPSFSRNDQPRREQPSQFQAEPTNLRYQPPLPPNNHNLPLNQLAYDPSYHSSYLSQPLNYPSNLLSTGPSLSALNPSAGLFGGYTASLREPLGGYQPSWAAENTDLRQRMAGLAGGVGDTGRISDRNPASTSRLDNSNGLLNKSLSSSAFGGIGAFPQSEAGKEKDRDKQQSYREELTRQMMEKEARKKKDKEEVERYNLKLEREVQEYNPWGKGGGGAPLRDQTGKLVSDLRQMHQYNKEGTIISPRDGGKSVESSMFKDTLSSSKPTEVSPPPKADQFQPSPLQGVTDNVQKNSQQEYKEYLRQQMEEKQRKKKEEEDRLREIEERQDKIVQEQQRKLKEEYERELEASKQKEEAARQKNEELRKAAEEKKKESERKRLEEDKKQEEKLKKQLDERLKAAKAKNANRSESPPVPSVQNAVRSNSPPIPTLQKKVEATERLASPPIPTLQNKVRSNSPPLPTLQNKEREEPQEAMKHPSVQRQPSADKQFSRPQSSPRREHQSPMPGTSHENDHQGHRSRPTSATADIDVLSQLTSLRRQLKKEEVKVQQQLSENKEKYVKLRENSATRKNKKPNGNVFDNVVRKQSSTSQRYHEAQTSGAINEFNKLKYEENSSLHGDFLNKYPGPATSSSTLDLQQKSLLQEQQKRLDVFQDTAHTSDKENLKSFGNKTRPRSNTSQLESESQFVPVDDPSQVNTFKQSPRMPSARERRRWKQLENLAKAPKLSDYKPPTPGGFSLNSVTSFNVDELAQKNEERLRKLEAMKQARSESKSDPNEVLKRFIQQHSRPDSKVSENSLPGEKRYLPNM